MADTYTFSFYDSGDDWYRFTSTLNGTTIDNTTALSSIPNIAYQTSWTGTFGSETTIFGSSYLNSNLVEIAISGSNATMTLADGTTLEGTTTWANMTRTFSDMQVTSSGSGGGGGGSTATQLDQPTATASISASGVITISGLNDANADGYKVKYWNTSSSESNATTTNTLTPTNGSVDVSVSTGLSYYLKVQAIGDGTTYSDSEWSAQISPIAAATTLNPPTNFKAAVSSDEVTATFTWTPNNLASGYKIRYSLKDQNDWTETDLLTGQSYQKIILTHGLYEAEIKSVGDGTTYSDSAYSGSSEFRIGDAELTPLDKPTPSAYAQGASIFITGLNVTNESGYKVKYWKTTAAESTAITTGTQQDYSGTLQFQPGPGFSYYVKVQAVGDRTTYSDSEWSSQLGPFAIVTTLSAPTGLTATASGTSISCSWNTVSAAAGYKLSYKTSASSNWSETDTIYTTAHVLTELSPNTTYNIRVKSVGNGVETNDSGYSTSVSATTGTSGTQLSAPSGFTATYANGVYTMSGVNVANAVGYKIWYTNDDSGLRYSGTVTATNGVIEYTPAVSDYWASPDGYEDTIRLQAIGDGTNYTDSDWSTPVNIVVSTPLSTPTITATGGDGQIVVSGLNVTNATSYDIGYKVNGASEWTTLVSVVPSAGSYTITGLSTPEDYYVKAKAKSSSASYTDSDWSTEVSASTDYVQTTLSAPTITTTTNDRHSIVVSGLNVANSTGYVISYSVHGEDNWITTNTVQAVSGSYTLSGLTVETVYDIKAKAIGDGGRYLDSPFSLVVTGETAAMAGSTGGIFRPIETTSTMLSSIEVESGQFIICTDTRKIYYDCSTNTRIELQ